MTDCLAPREASFSKLCYRPMSSMVSMLIERHVARGLEALVSQHGLLQLDSALWQI